MSKTIPIDEGLLRELLGEAEEAAERHADDRIECRAMGSADGALQCLKYERSTRRVIRRGRRLLADLLGVDPKTGERVP